MSLTTFGIPFCIYLWSNAYEFEKVSYIKKHILFMLRQYGVHIKKITWPDSESHIVVVATIFTKWRYFALFRYYWLSRLGPFEIVYIDIITSNLVRFSRFFHMKNSDLVIQVKFWLVLTNLGPKKHFSQRIQEYNKNTIFFPKKTIQITQTIHKHHTINHTINITKTFPKIHK